ncbi:MAG: septum formation initiator family protein [Bacteroidia bacterium]|nr:septum formation initiator family protein [Bacteroidia bacterium]
MKFLDRIPGILKNKYLLVIFGLGIWLLFFDRNDIFMQIKRRNEVKKLEDERDYYSNEIKINQQEIQELRSNPKELEKFAREHYLFKKDNEDIFIIVEDTASKK